MFKSERAKMAKDEIILIKRGRPKEREKIDALRIFTKKKNVSSF